MDSVQQTKLSNKNSKDAQLIKNKKKHSDNNINDAAQQEDYATNPHEPIRNNSVNSQNKNNPSTFKIINLKQKLQDQILFGNEWKHAHLSAASNNAQQRSRQKNYETHNIGVRTSKGDYLLNDIYYSD